LIHGEFTIKHENFDIYEVVYGVFFNLVNTFPDDIIQNAGLHELYMSLKTHVSNHSEHVSI
jgi:hypothetical protein